MGHYTASMKRVKGIAERMEGSQHMALAEAIQRLEAAKRRLAVIQEESRQKAIHDDLTARGIL